MDLTKILLSQMGNDGLSQLAGQVGASPDQARSALEGVIPSLLGGMTNRAQSQDGLSALLSMLDRDGDGDIFDDLPSFLGQATPERGQGIADQVLGNSRGQVEQGLSSKTGLDVQQISKLVALAGPMVMSYLNKQKRQGGLEGGGLAEMLGQMTAEADQGTSLDLGDIFNALGTMSGGGQQQSGGGLGNLLGRFLKG